MKLLFVYNADSGFIHFCKDALHKWFSPATYPCKLCDLTYSNLGEKKAWRVYYQSLEVRSEFLYKDQYSARFSDATLSGVPCVLLQNRQGTKEVISANEFKHIHSLSQLQQVIDQVLQP